MVSDLQSTYGPVPRAAHSLVNDQTDVIRLVDDDKHAVVEDWGQYIMETVALHCQYIMETVVLNCLVIHLPFRRCFLG